MAAPCYEGQARDRLKVPPAVTKAFMQEMMEHIKGGPAYPEMAHPGAAPKYPISYGEALQKMSEQTGLQVETINTILRRDPQVKSITKQALARSGDARRIRDAAETFAEQLKGNAKLHQEPGRIAKVWDAQRRLALGGHSVVFPWSHMRNWAIQLPTEAGRARMSAFWRAATDVYRYAGEKGKALYEMDMGLMQAGDHYDFFKSSGADLVPGVKGPGNIILENSKPKWTTRNFDALKPARYSALLNVWNSLDPALKAGETGKAMAAMIARDMNYATGSIMPPVGEAANPMARSASEISQMTGRYNLLLSSKLFFGKHMDAWLSPLRYIAKGGRATPAESAARNIAMGRWANTVAAHVGILGANYAFNKALGWKTPNLTNPTQSDFLRLRLGDNIVVPFSPMLEALRLPIVFTATMSSKGSDEAGSRLWRAVWNAAHPSLHTGYEQISGKDFMGRPISFSLRNLATKLGAPPPTDKYGHPLKGEPTGAVEYLSTRLSPIAISGGLREFYQALRDTGMEGGMATAFIKGALAMAASGLVGQHVYEEQPKPPPSTGTSLYGGQRGSLYKGKGAKLYH